MKIKSLLEDISGASRVTKRREENFNKGDERNLYDDPINKVARELHPAPFKVRLTDIKIASKTAKTLRFEPLEGKLPIFQAGQYVVINLSVGKTTTSRPYSISSAPFEAQLEKPFFEITVRKGKPNEGFVSSFLYEEAKIGEEYLVDMPYGHFHYEELRDAPFILGLSGGSGITPFLSMAKEIAHGDLDIDLTILHGSLNEEDVIAKEELEGLADRCDRIKVINVYSDDGAKASKDDEKGFITASLIKKYSLDNDPTNAKTSFFVCGPRPMYHFVKKELDSLNAPARRIRMEVFGSSNKVEEINGYPMEKKGDVFSLTVVRGIQEDVIPARADEPIAVALERAGILIRTCCRSGECGRCRAKLLEGEVFVPSDSDQRRAADKRFNYIYTCSTYPMGDLKVKIDII